MSKRDELRRRAKAIHATKNSKGHGFILSFIVDGVSSRLIGQIDRTWYKVFDDDFLDAVVRERALIMRHMNRVAQSFADERNMPEFKNVSSGGLVKRQYQRDNYEGGV